LIHLCPRARVWFLALLLVASTATLGCFFHTGVMKVRSPAYPDGESRDQLSEEDIAVVVSVVEKVAMDEGFRAKRSASVPFGSKLLVYYASEEQISLAASVSRDSRSISIRIRDVNHIKETSYIEGLRVSIESGIRAKLPDLEISYDTTR
jgi:hypothetical protein